VVGEACCGDPSEDEAIDRVVDCPCPHELRPDDLEGWQLTEFWGLVKRSME
jgi:hypothetical protein